MLGTRRGLVTLGLLLAGTTPVWAHPDPAVHLHADGSLLVAIGLAAIGALMLRRLVRRFVNGG